MARRSNSLQDSMQNTVPVAVQNNFIAGLKTEFTGLNFPSNACTDTQNCIFSMIGDVTRRPGIDYETNFSQTTINRTGKAVNSFRWLNAGGDGLTQIYVLQVGGTLYFYNSTTATVASPLSAQKLSSTVTLSSFLATGSSADPSITECQFTSGNGYLFVYHPNLDPFYCTYNAGTITGFPITVQIRDFAGIQDGYGPSLRSPGDSIEHQYNLQNQGWTSGFDWIGTSATSIALIVGSMSFTTQSGLAITVGDQVSGSAFNPYPNTGPTTTMLFTGQVTAYSGTGLTINVQSINTPYNGFVFTTWTIQSNGEGFIGIFHEDTQVFPSNSDVWYTFKNSLGVFDPSTTLGDAPPNTGGAPQGHYVLNAFMQQRTLVSTIAGLTDVTTKLRPKTGAWFQGRVWYTGVDASQQSTGDAMYYTWAENIYFSQIVTTAADFGTCYQTNDPTDEDLFSLLPSDGGVIQIQGSGSIYKLFPIQNGMLVFAANGIWFITGSQGIGFTANDYTITKISAVESIASTSYVDVQGVPIFWNEEGIYAIEPAQQGLGLTVAPITLDTILSFYNEIPLDSKKYVKVSYNPITYTVQWLYRSTQETDVTSRYQYDSVLNLNTHTKAFFPYTVSTSASSPHINDVTYIASPGGSAAPPPAFKYLTSVAGSGTYQFTFSEEKDETHFVDWYSVDSIGINYHSYFVTGYALDGQGQRMFQPGYIYMYSRNSVPTSYKIRGIWDFANSRDSGRYSQDQLVTNGLSRVGMLYRRHRIRGNGVALQIRVSSADGFPFDIMGWSIWTTQNTGV